MRGEDLHHQSADVVSGQLSHISDITDGRHLEGDRPLRADELLENRLGWPPVLRAAKPDDVDLIREWRNQSANREVSTHQHEIAAEEHEAWWQRASVDPGRRVLVFEEEGRARGVVNFFDLADVTDERIGSWGFFLDNETAVAEGTAMMLWVRIMADAVDYAFDELELDVLEGEVLEQNEVVRLMNRRFRFVEGDAVERSIDGRTISVIPISLRRSDRRVRRSR